MKMHGFVKRLSTALLSVVMLLGLAACSNGQTQSSVPAPSEAGSQPTESEVAHSESTGDKTYTDISEFFAPGTAQDVIPESAKSGAEGEGEWVVGFSNGFFGNAWRAQCIDAVTAAGENLKNAGLISELLVSNVNGVTEQIAAINDFINKKVDAIVILPANANALAPVMKQAVDAGIVVLSTDDAGLEAPIINGDQKEYMGPVTQWLMEEISCEGKIINITGVPGENSDTLRGKTVHEIVDKYPDVEIVAEAPGEWTNSVTNTAVTSLLSVHGDDLDGIIVPDSALGALQAFTAAGVEPVPMVGDYTLGFLREWSKNPNLKAIVNTCAPDMHVTSLYTAVMMLQGKEVNTDALEDNGVNGNINMLVVPMPCVVVRDAPAADAEWVKMLKPTTKIFLLDEVLEACEGLSENACLEGHLNWEETEAAYFK